jgi:two-component system nitrogen regulation response regulator GlnG
MNDAVWHIDDDDSIRWVLQKALKQADIDTVAFATADEALARLASEVPCAIVTDIRMPGTSGLELLRNVHGRLPDLPVIVMTAHSDLDSAVSSYQGGAFEYLPKPFDVDEAVATVRRAVEAARKADASSESHPANGAAPEIIGRAPAMQEVFRAIGRLSGSNVTVLITGPSGSGKELVARALHRHSRRAAQNFVALNVAAIPSELIESELFGHEKGAFTGAANRRTGRFEQADGGTLFLDEIGDMPREAQTRLLRVLAEGEFYRVGGHTPITVDVRIIAATHQHLEELVTSGAFREDLFHRLNVIRVHVPSLAERREDIPLLTRHFLNLAAAELGEEVKRLPDATGHYLANLPWPGNVRQLENTCRWLTVMAAGREILIEDLPAELRPQSGVAPDETGDWQAALAGWATQALADGRERILDEAGPRFERTMIIAAMQHAGGKRKTAAELLGWGRNTLTRKIDELKLASRFGAE